MWASGDNVGFLAISSGSLFLLWPSPRKQEETGDFPNCSHSIYQKNPRPTETNWGQPTARLLANCNHYTGRIKFPQIVEKYRHKRISHLTLESLAWDSKKNVPKDWRDLSHCSTQHSTQDLMTEGVAVVIILLWVPPQPPSNRFSAALPNPGRRERHKERCLWPDGLQLVKMRTMTGFPSGPAWKHILHVWVGEERIADGILQGCIMSVTHPIPMVRASGLKDTWDRNPRKGQMWWPNHFFHQ